MTRPQPLALVFVGLLTATAAQSDTGSADQTPKPRAEQPAQNRWVSNWPANPERQGGREYTKFTRPELGGPVERNFESGRN